MQSNGIVREERKEEREEKPKRYDKGLEGNGRTSG
jgi:hypothetical protein